jgi:peptidoglycan/xylan/chitin deacetylase (PgdA/CDA1 family)
VSTSSPIPILCYHAVSDDTGGSLAPWVISTERFEAHLDAIAAAGYRPITVGQLVEQVHDRGLLPAPGTAVLTFDDGYADVADEVWPRLLSRGWSATVYVSTGLGPRHHDRAVLAPSGVAQLARAGIEIGAHGHRHLELDAVRRSQAEIEIRRSRELLEDWIGGPVTTFAYPHGYHDRRVRQRVIDAGYRSACAVKQLLSSATDDRFALARIMPTGDVSAERLVELMAGGAARARPGRERPATTAWRMVRRARARWAA